MYEYGATALFESEELNNEEERAFHFASTSWQSRKLGLSQVVASAERLDEKRRKRYFEIGSTLKRRTNDHLIEAQNEHAQFLSIIEGGEPGVSLLLSLHDQVGGIEIRRLQDVLRLVHADMSTVRLFSKAGLLALEGDRLVLSEQGAQIAAKIDQLTNEE